MAYVTFAINFVTMKEIFAYQFFKDGLNRDSFDKTNMANT